MGLACPWETQKITVGESHALAAYAVPNDNDTHARWKTVNAVRIGDHENLQNTLMQIPESVSRTPACCIICPEEPSKIRTLALASTVSMVLEGYKTAVLVVNTTPTLDKLKQ